MSSALSTLNTTTEVTLSKNPQLLPRRRSIKGCPLLQVCVHGVCVFTAVCVHFGWVKCRARIQSMGHHTWPKVTSLSLIILKKGFLLGGGGCSKKGYNPCAICLNNKPVRKHICCRTVGLGLEITLTLNWNPTFITTYGNLIENWTSTILKSTYIYRKNKWVSHYVHHRKVCECTYISFAFLPINLLYCKLITKMQPNVYFLPT